MSQREKIACVFNLFFVLKKYILSNNFYGGKQIKKEIRSFQLLEMWLLTSRYLIHQIKENFGRKLLNNLNCKGKRMVSLWFGSAEKRVNLWIFMRRKCQYSSRDSLEPQHWGLKETVEVWNRSGRLWLDGSGGIEADRRSTTEMSSTILIVSRRKGAFKAPLG